MKSAVGPILSTLAVLPVVASAHHSVLGLIDRDTTLEFDGVVIEVSWRNPHVQLVVETVNDANERVAWELEGAAPNLLRRAGLEPDSITVGETVRVAGNPYTSTPEKLSARNILLSSGEEIFLSTNARPLWSSHVARGGTRETRSRGDASSPDLGIFRVWSTTTASPQLLPQNVDRDFDLGSYPMTTKAREAQQAFDPLADNPLAGCTPKGMPTIMERPFALEFSEAGSVITLNIEQYDVERTIHMDQAQAPDDARRSPFGYSVGSWDGDDLVVTTTNISWPWLDRIGTPLSDQAVLVERFSPEPDGSRLDYRVTVDDDVNFTEPVTFEQFWIYVPERQILPFDCLVRD